MLSHGRPRLLTITMIVSWVAIDHLCGEKWASHVEDQGSNVTNASAVMIRLPAQHGEPTTIVIAIRRVITV